MTRHRGTGTPADGENPDRPPPPPSPADIGRVLREKREALGLDLLTVHDRLGRPITQLEALENGDLSRLHNQAFALSTLRRYARFLTLDGDALALQFMQSVSVGRPGPPSPPPAGRRGAASTPTGMVAAVDSGPEHLRAFTQTGPVPRVGGYDNGFTGTGFGSVGPPTGTLSVIPREQIKETRKVAAKARRSRQAPALLRLATWLVLAALLVALVGVGIRYWRPQLLVQWHIARPTERCTWPPHRHPPPRPRRTTPGTPPVKQVSTDNQTEATYTVSNAHFKVILTTTAPVLRPDQQPGIGQRHRGGRPAAQRHQVVPGQRLTDRPDRGGRRVDQRVGEGFERLHHRPQDRPVHLHLQLDARAVAHGTGPCSAERWPGQAMVFGRSESRMACAHG